MKNFTGNLLFLDRSDINTDEIIPAKYLTENFKEALRPHLLEDLKIAGFESGRDVKDKQAIISRANFGCGSSREHAPWALEVNGINIVIAENFARIFRQNMFNCGMLAVELPAADINDIFLTFAPGPARLTLDFAADCLTLQGAGAEKKYAYSIAAFDKSLVEAGGWVDYADKKY
ncbi:MAG: 3-isopropylmalate dehydratase small subunit [Spirochaetales bacterium]|jgi:3-isopropylmalate/(R)-2-methylmalate dehydratase small subunit|nr:3-isopropylmalate dehydratase small subunit [Spirochaetales bacterium]